MRRGARRSISLAFSLAAAACGGGSSEVIAPGQPYTPPPTAGADTTPLRVYAARRNLLIGAAIDRGFRLTGSDGSTFRSIMSKQFGILTPENDMKFDHLHPARDTYRFASADSLVAFAESNGMRVRGHNLVWHSQLPSWLTTGTWPAAEAQQVLTDHIATVVSHYRGHVLEWDVVNEALADDGSLRPGFWTDHIGRTYIEAAFQAARAADPNAGLFYNDYNIEGLGAKSDSAYVMVKDLLARGVPITGVGFESHFVLGGVPGTLAANIARFAALGLQVHITELDVRIQAPTTPAALQTQAQNYREVVSACMSSPACNVIVLWGFTDRESWIPSTFPGWGDALIYDASYQPKPAYTAIQRLLAL
jgi:endo-1,4-beta-xylanase